MSQGEKDSRLVLLGRISGAHGVKGWVRIMSYTEPREAILEYSPWLMGDHRRLIEPIEGGRHGRTVIARLNGVQDRDAAAALVGQDIRIDRGQLPEAGEGHYYWTDLIGLEVVLEDGESLGAIEDMMATGANDVMVVAGNEDGRQRLIPFVEGETVLDVDLEAGKIRVRWDRDF